MANLVVFTLLLTFAAATSPATQCFQITNVVGESSKTQCLTQNDLIGPSGPVGPPGVAGPEGPIGPAGKMPAESSIKLSSLEKRIEELEKSTKKQTEKAVGRSCGDYLVSDPGMKSGYFLIAPNPKFEAPFKVYCKVGGGHAWTTFGHDSEKEIRAENCEERFCAKRNVKYNMKLTRIRPFVEKSNHCRQYVKFRCMGVVNNWGEQQHWSWTSWDGKKHLNWPEGKGNGMCKCGMTQSCIKIHQKCNCDNNSGGVNTFDDGYVTDKAQLPVIQMAFGDMGSASEKGWHTLGKLECY